MAVEGLGGWQDPRSHDGPRHRALLRGREEAEEEDAAGLSLGESALPQLVGVQVLPLRGSRPPERHRPNVPDESLLRWRVPDLRHRRAALPRVGSGGPRRPDDLRLPAYDQVHVLQVRGERRGRAPRCRLHTAPQRGQREDLCVPLVLVPLSRGAQPPDRHLQGHHNIFAAHAGLPAAAEVSPGAPRGRRDDRAPQQSRRLVPPLHARREPRHGHLQGRDARAGESAGLQASPQRARRQGRAAGGLTIAASLLPLIVPSSSRTRGLLRALIISP